MNELLVDGRFMPDNDLTDRYIEKLSRAAEISVQYPDGALWYVECGKWTKRNNA